MSDAPWNGKLYADPRALPMSGMSHTWIRDERHATVARVDVSGDHPADVQFCTARAEAIAHRSNMYDELVKALAFAASCIKGGEPWTDTCEQVIGGAIRATFTK